MIFLSHEKSDLSGLFITDTAFKNTEKQPAVWLAGIISNKTLKRRLIMRINVTIVLLIFLLVNVRANSFSQTVTFSGKEVSVEKVISAIRKQTGYVFFYNTELLKKARPISLTLKNRVLNEALDLCFKDQPLDYFIKGKTIVIKEREKDQPERVAPADTPPVDIRGKVTDEKGESLPGATVRVKGTDIATVTDANGNFSLRAIEADATVIVSYTGFITGEVPVSRTGVLTVILKDDLQKLGEVVVVGYGLQKKVHMTGSVSTVNSEQLTNRPVMNLTSALAGTAPGVSVTQSNGNPGSESVSIRLRGTGSFNNSAPLILVDGVVADMVPLNSDDIENISILKDASASIYGARAANGVILVTTKKGRKEAPRISFNALYASEKPVTDMKYMSSTADFMELHNIAKVNANPTTTSPDYATATIEEWRAANADPNGTYTNPVTGQTIPNWLAYPNTDWAQVLFQPEIYQRYGMSVNGGSQNTSYLMSLGYQKNPGTLKNTQMERFNVRLNLETKIADLITFGTQTYATKEYKQPGSTSMTYLQQAFPGITPVYEGKYGASEDPNTTNKDNILQQVVATGGLYDFSRINTTWYANADLWKGLVAEARFNYSEYMREDETYSQDVPKYSFRESMDTPKESIGNLEQATTYRYAYNSKSYTANLLLRYNNSFGKHDVGGVFGYEQYKSGNSGFSATKKGLLDWSVTDITSGATMEAIGGSAKEEYAMISYFGRANYAYDDKYLLEALFRSDASSKFAPGKRTGFFPSFSAGWVVSREPFFAPVLNSVNYFKLRASYGTSGNTVSGNYDWQTLYQKVNNVFNEQVSNGIIQQTIQNLGLSWEKLASYNLGLETKFLNNRLSAEADLYYKKTSDILTSAIIYLTMGNIDAPMANTASMYNKGIDLMVGWNDRIGDFKYGISANLNYNINRVTGFKGTLNYGLDPSTPDIWGNPTYRYTNLADVSTGSTTRRVENKMIDEWFLRRPYNGNGTYTNSDGSVNPDGGPLDGMVRTRADLEWVKSMIAAGYSFNNNTVGPNAANIWYGQMIMADANGDGRYGNDDDREFTGKSSTPRFIFGVNLNAAWKNFDVNMIWDGRLGSYHYIEGRGVNSSILSNTGDVVPADAWTRYYFYNATEALNNYDNYDPASDPDANINGKYPRLLSASSSMVTNTFYLYNSSYIKLRSLQIGYTLPKKWINRVKMANFRIFASGENLLTIKHKDFEGVDPELGSSLIVYPLARLFSAGVNVTF